VRRVLLALAVLLTVLAVVAIRAPAAWLADAVAARSKLRLVDARGTLWHGTALLGVSNGRETTLLPGRLEWIVTGVQPNRIWARLSHDWLTAPVDLGLGPAGVHFAKGSARLPAAVLAAAGAPFNTLRPGGVLELRWSEADLSGTALNGELQVDWRDAQSALSPVVPLGSYRLRVAGTAGPPSLELQTLSGPLEMRGSGKMEGSHIRFRGVAAVQRDMQPALNGLLGLLGMRSGDKVLLAIDT
jgi:general secretion pathway protein N